MPRVLPSGSRLRTCPQRLEQSLAAHQEPATSVAGSAGVVLPAPLLRRPRRPLPSAGHAAPRSNTNSRSLKRPTRASPAARQVLAPPPPPPHSAAPRGQRPRACAHPPARPLGADASAPQFAVFPRSLQHINDKDSKQCESRDINRQEMHAPRGTIAGTSARPPARRSPCHLLQQPRASFALTPLLRLLQARALPARAPSTAGSMAVSVEWVMQSCQGLLPAMLWGRHVGTFAQARLPRLTTNHAVPLLPQGRRNPSDACVGCCQQAISCRQATGLS